MYKELLALGISVSIGTQQVLADQRADFPLTAMNVTITDTGSVASYPFRLDAITDAYYDTRPVELFMRMPKMEQRDE